MARPSSSGSVATFVLTPQGPFSLAASRAFLERFRPAAYAGDPGRPLELVFVVDGGEEPVAVRLRQEDGVVAGEVYGEADPAVVREQVARILSLDVDGSGFDEVGQRDSVIGQLQGRYPGLRPVNFNSPFEAAVWALLSHRVRMSQAAKIRARLVAELGPTVNLDGETRQAFPGPLRLLGLTSFDGLFGRKPEWLRALAEAALECELDAAALRNLPSSMALAQLKALPGIGDFSAGLILLRGAGAPDALPIQEPRVLQGLALAYGLEGEPTYKRLGQLAESWRPYRTWVCVLLRRFLEDSAQEAGRRPGRPARFGR
jgi:DNA-3-methyladenine glycosylase II